MTPETIKFLHHIIRRHNIDVMHTETEAEYTIEIDDGTVFGFSCIHTTDDRGRQGRFYAATINDNVIAEGFCTENGKPNTTTHQLMELVRSCSNKLLTQEIKARQTGLLKQLEANKYHN